MRIAQSLYEGVVLGGQGGERVALITYMRTDGVQMSDEGIAAAREYISTAFGTDDDWLPSSPRAFTRKARNAQEAHEAIRPVTMERTPLSLRGQLEPAQLRLYELIWRRAIASQMANAVHEQLAITLQPQPSPCDNGGTSPASPAASRDDEDVPAVQARASGSRLVVAGYKALYQQTNAVSAAEATQVDDGDGALDGADGAANNGQAEGDGSGARAVGDDAADDAADEGALDPLLSTLTEGDILVRAHADRRARARRPAARCLWPSHTLSAPAPA